MPFMRWLFSRETLWGWAIVLGQRIAQAIDTWGNVDFAVEKAPFIIRVFQAIWEIITHEFWGSTLMLAGGIFLIWLGVRKHLQAYSEYQRPIPPTEGITVVGTVSTILTKPGLIPKTEFTTRNENDREIHVNATISAVRFLGADRDHS